MGGKVTVTDAEAKIILFKLLPPDLKMTATDADEIAKIIGCAPETVK
jgi:hypothetical protein